jgi:hypothetical protein
VITRSGLQGRPQSRRRDVVTKRFGVVVVSVVIALSWSSPVYARSTNANGGAAAAHGGAGHWSGSPHGHWAGGHHGFRGHAGMIVADPLWWDADPFGYWPPPPPPMIAQQAPPEYIERHAPGAHDYCPSAGAYYPDVTSCAEPWIRVAPERP